MLVHKIDRLARNVADHAMIRVLLKRAGIRLASVVENLDDSVSGQLVEHMMAAVAEFHSANLSEETKKGMRQMVMQGGWPHLPPRGYIIDRDSARSRIVIHPHEGPLMAEAFELYATGWWSVKRLALHLAQNGLVSRSGGPLPHSHLERLLRNPFYAGRIEWKDLRVPGTHPPLVSPDLFERAQKVRGGRRKDAAVPRRAARAAASYHWEVRLLRWRHHHRPPRAPAVLPLQPPGVSERPVRAAPVLPGRARSQEAREYLPQHPL